MVYKFTSDLLFFVSSGEEENEIIVGTVLQALFESISLLLRGIVEKRTALENLDLILLSIDEIVESLEAITVLVKSVNSKVSVLFTVSPVRHLKDGFTQNQLSKSHLITAIHQVVEPRNNTHYFPSYEIMMDELRDYRFYAEDMIHPNQTAINYIWEKFVNAWISEESKETMKEIKTIQNGLNHRPFNPSSKEHQQFLQSLQVKIKALQKKYSFIDL